jgi:hypothetical protein
VARKCGGLHAIWSMSPHQSLESGGELMALNIVIAGGTVRCERNMRCMSSYCEHLQRQALCSGNRKESCNTSFSGTLLLFPPPDFFVHITSKCQIFSLPLHWSYTANGAEISRHSLRTHVVWARKPPLRNRPRQSLNASSALPGSTR